MVTRTIWEHSQNRNRIKTVQAFFFLSGIKRQEKVVTMLKKKQWGCHWDKNTVS